MKTVRVAIVGSGFAGLGAAIRLKEEGIEDLVIFERAAKIGGVWRDNSYPGCACDVESHLYSFSFAPNPGWTRTFSPQAEIQEYLERCADRYDLRKHLELGCAVLEASWSETDQRWTVQTERGAYSAEILISAVGALSEPSLPELPGLENFQGAHFHSARWNHEHDLTNEKVAVIGTGASAIQFVPAIQPQAGQLDVYQRTPAWIIPRRDRAISPDAQRLFREHPWVQRWIRNLIYVFRDLFAIAFLHPALMRLNRWVALRHLHKQVRDPALRAKLTPSYTIGCKRILLSDDYLPALTRENVEVVTAPIKEVRARSIVTEDGVERPVDTIIFGTGFRVTEIPIAEHVRGTDGRTLDEVWAGSPKAHLGTMVSGFPNFFMLLGPNTGLGHSSVVLMIESQIDHMLGALRFMRKNQVRAIEPRRAVQESFIKEIDEKLATTVWNSGGCKSWYIDKTGRNSTIWPGFTWSFKDRLKHFDPSEYSATFQKQSPLT